MFSRGAPNSPVQHTLGKEKEKEKDTEEEVILSITAGRKSFNDSSELNSSCSAWSGGGGLSPSPGSIHLRLNPQHPSPSSTTTTEDFFLNQIEQLNKSTPFHTSSHLHNNNNNNSIFSYPSSDRKHPKEADKRSRQQKDSQSNALTPEEEEVWIELTEESGPPTTRRNTRLDIHNNNKISPIIEQTPLNQILSQPPVLGSPSDEARSVAQALFLPRTHGKDNNNNDEEEEDITDPGVLAILSQEPFTDSKPIEVQKGYTMPSPSTPLWGALLGNDDDDAAMEKKKKKNSTKTSAISLPRPLGSMDILHDNEEDGVEEEGVLTQEYRLQSQRESLPLRAAGRRSQSGSGTPARKSAEEWANAMNRFFEKIDQRPLIAVPLQSSSSSSSSVGPRQQNRASKTPSTSKGPPRTTTRSRNNNSKSRSRPKANSFSEMIALAKMKAEMSKA